MENWIENGNLFMMCEELNPSALTEVPEGYLQRYRTMVTSASHGAVLKVPQ